MKSIQWKLITIYNIIVLIVMIMSGVFILWQLESYEYKKIQDDLRAVVGSFLEVEFRDEEEETIIYTFKEYLTRNMSFYTDKNTQIYILDKNGEFIFSSDEQKPKAFDTYAIISAVNGISKFENITSYEKDDVARSMMGYAYPIMIEDNVKVILYTTTYTQNIEDTLSRARTIIAFSIVLAVILSILLWFVFSKIFTEPIKKLTVTAKKFARGELYQNLEVKSNDEIGQLTRTFNYMAVELNKTLADISNEKNKLETVFEHMKDGIMAFNNAGSLIHANKVAYKILGTRNKISTIEKLMEILGIEITKEEILDTKTSQMRMIEIKLNRKILNIIIATYLNERLITEGIIVMIQDVTEQRRLDNMRKEFVANVSHELRTPLTTVKSYVETLLEGEVENADNNKKFLSIINTETDRMVHLVQDLLELSRFDNNQIKFTFIIDDLYLLVRDVCNAQKIQANMKNQNLVVNVPDEEKNLLIDPDRVVQVLNNILSNSIKYSEEKATITVSVKETDTEIEISVKDTGMGIPKEDLSRVFERFYRVDKARSRAMGGTGLGLSIAKEIMVAHGGSIRLESEYKVGTTVYLKFPKGER